MIPILAPLFEGDDLRPFGERLQCAPAVPAGAVRVADLLAPDALMDVMRRNARFRRSDGRDLRPIASAWSLEYLAALLPPVIAAATVLEQVFPIGADETWVVLDDDGHPVRFHILHTGTPMPSAATTVRYAPLLWQHLAPLFETLARLTRLAPKILWGNAAREFDVVFEQALALTGLPAIAEDWARLVRDPVWPSRHFGGGCGGRRADAAAGLRQPAARAAARSAHVPRRPLRHGEAAPPVLPLPPAARRGLLRRLPARAGAPRNRNRDARRLTRRGARGAAQSPVR
jgi:ferric iron reductase protein FhuF